MGQRRGVGRVFEAALSGVATQHAVEEDPREEIAENSLVESESPSVLFRGLEYGAITGACAGVATNLCIGIAAFFFELFIGNDADGPLGIFAFFAFGGTIVALIIGTVIGILLGLAYTLMGIQRFAMWTTPALLATGYVIIGLYNTQFGFFRLGMPSMLGTAAVLIAYTAGYRFDEAVRDGRIRRVR